MLTQTRAIHQIVNENQAPAAPLAEPVCQISQIYEQTSETVLAIDRQGLIVYVNRAFEQITGYTRSELLGQDPRSLKSGAHDAIFDRRVWDTFRRGETFTGEITGYKKNDEPYQALITITPLHDAQGEITHFVASGKPLSELDQRLEVTPQVDECLRHTLDHMQVGCMLIDFNWIYRYVNEAVACQAHALREDFLGRSVMEVHPGIEQTSLFAHYLECQVQRIPQHFIAENPFGDGSPGWVEFRVEPASEGIFVLTG